jgi:hypothetical protein
MKRRSTFGIAFYITSYSRPFSVSVKRKLLPLPQHPIGVRCLEDFVAWCWYSNYLFCLPIILYFIHKAKV